MQSVLFDAQPDNSDLVTDLWECGTAGILEEDGYLRAFFEDSADLTPLLLRRRAIDVRRDDAPGFSQFPREDWDPILVGERFFIAPSWVEASTPPGRFRLSIDTTAAFGTGRHESTQLMLQVLEQELRAEQTVLDVGCGSGILALAATLLGARHVFACDIDEAVAGGVRELKIPAFAGSADCVRDGVADLVLANISARVNDAIAWDLQRVTKPGGLILLAGFISENPPKYFTPFAACEQGDWLCWSCRKEDVAPASDRPSPLQAHPRLWW